MTLSLIVAFDRNLLIGCEGGIPWRLAADLKRFRRLTLGKPIIMGRTTFEHIGKPLDKRPNIVISGRDDFRPAGVTVVPSPEQALEAAQQQLAGSDEVMIIGGGKVYTAFAPQATRLYLTMVDGDYAGNAWFPGRIDVPAGQRWVVQTDERLSAIDGQPAHCFIVADRIADSRTAAHQLDVIGLFTKP